MTVRRPLVALTALAAALALMVPILAGRAGAADSTVTIVHGIPGVDVDVYVEGSLTLPGFVFGDLSDPLTLAAGDYDVQVFGAIPSPPADAASRVDTAVITQTLTVPSGANVSVVADLVGGIPVLTPFVNDVGAVPEGSSRVTVRHAADAPAVNVLVNGQVAIPDLAPGAQASAVLPAGTYEVTVQLTDGTALPALSPGSVTIPAGKNVIIYATGSASDADFPLGLVQQVLDVPVTPAVVPTTPTTEPPAAVGVTANPAVTG